MMVVYKIFSIFDIGFLISTWAQIIVVGLSLCKGGDLEQHFLVLS